MISIIVAASTNMVIGKDNELPWHIPNDLKTFKNITEGKRIYMGRKCWESLPEKFRPLPNRENVVITRDKDYKAKGAIVINDLTMLIESLSIPITNKKESLVIGGSEIYKEFFPIAEKIYLTEILNDVNGDTYLKGFNPEEWLSIYQSEIYEENSFKYRFKQFKRKS